MYWALPQSFSSPSSCGTERPTAVPAGALMPRLRRRCHRSRRLSPRRRSARNRCSGRGCPRGRAGSPLRRAPDRRRAGHARRPACPGVQKPHWKAPLAANARCSACMRGVSTRPSRVRTGRSTHPCASDRQERIGTPSISTVQAPHTPWLQPRLAAVRCSSSRSTVSSVVDRPARTSAATPLMSSSTRVETGLMVVVALMRRSPLRPGGPRAAAGGG